MSVKNKVAVFLLLGIVFVSHVVRGETNSDFDTLIQRISGRARTELRDFEKKDVAEYLRLQLPDGRWSDIDYTQKGRSHWDTIRHLERCVLLAGAFRITGESSCRDAVHRAIGWWLNKRPRNSSWWFNAIGSPRLLANCAIRFDGELTDEERNSIVEVLKSSVPQKRMTGQNAAWIDEIRFMRGIIARDENLVRNAIKDMISEVRISDGEGITRDWCFHQHGHQPQFGNYGRSFLEDQSRMVMILDGTKFVYPKEKVTLIRNLAEYGFSWISWKGMMDVSAMGRQLFPDAQKKKALSVERAFIHLAQTGNKIAADPKGFRYFDKSAYAVYRTDEWMASIRASTSSIIGVETWVNEDNVKGMCMADGALFVYVTGKEYENIFPLWDDWRMIPGVTGYAGMKVDRKQHMNETDDIRVIDNKEADGVFTFTFKREGLTARKKWTFSKDDILCEGFNISATNENYCVMTSVEEALASENARIVYERPDEFCVRNGSVHYIVYAPREAIHFKLADRQGDFREFMQAHPSHSVTGKVFSLRISHGIKPNNASYKYRIIPVAKSK